MTQATLQCKLEGHTSDINCCAWSPITWSTLTSCSGDRTLRVWDISSEPPKTLSVVPASKYYVNACAYNPSGDLLATASSGDEGIVKLWSTASWTVVGENSVWVGLHGGVGEGGLQLVILCGNSLDSRPH